MRGTVEVVRIRVVTQSPTFRLRNQGQQGLPTRSTTRPIIHPVEAETDNKAPR